MSQALARNPQVEYRITVLNGKDKGVSYKLMSSHVTIGRDNSNDIVIAHDPKVSRQHATIVSTPRGFELINNSDRNKIQAQSEFVDSLALTDGATFQLGETKFRFNANSLVPKRTSPGPQGVASPQEGFNPYSAQNSRSRNQKSKKLRFYVIVGIIGVFLYWILSTDNKDSQEAQEQDQIRSDAQVEADMAAAKALQEQALLDPKKTWNQSVATREAQAAYVRGFRDYQKGRFYRAMEAFQACLSLVPSHELCGRYLNLARKRHNEILQYHMILGRQYRDQSQFNACQSAFKNVMVMARDPSAPIYKEAKQNYDACTAQLRGRF